MLRKATVVLIFIALFAVTLSQVVNAGSTNGSGSKPTSPKVHPTPKPKPTSPKPHGDNNSETSYIGASRIFNIN